MIHPGDDVADVPEVSNHQLELLLRRSSGSNHLLFKSFDHAMYLCSGRDTVSVRKLKSHPRIVFVSDNPPSAFNLSSATIFLRGIGSFTSIGRATTSITRGMAASNRSAFLVPGKSTVRPVGRLYRHQHIPLDRRECRQ